MSRDRNSIPCCALRARVIPWSCIAWTAWPQCDGTYSYLTAYSLGVVGVTSGHAFRNNPCFARQDTWATTGNLAPESIYLNLNEDIGITAANGDTGPYGHCPAESACHALNYGYNAASSAYTYIASQAPTFVAQMWWLDIETEKSWSEQDLGRNQNVIKGALRYLGEERHFMVGIYSTASMWQEITGGWLVALPVWVGRGTKAKAQTQCGVGFTGGQVYLVQYTNDACDGNYVC